LLICAGRVLTQLSRPARGRRQGPLRRPHPGGRIWNRDAEKSAADVNGDTLAEMLKAGLDQAHTEGLIDAADICGAVAKDSPPAKRVALVLADALRSLGDLTRRNETSRKLRTTRPLYAAAIGRLQLRVGADPELDSEIGALVGHTTSLSYTSSAVAAFTLLPDGFSWSGGASQISSASGLLPIDPTRRTVTGWRVSVHRGAVPASLDPGGGIRWGIVPPMCPRIPAGNGPDFLRY
jgi:hypothetical protein